MNNPIDTRSVQFHPIIRDRNKLVACSVRESKHLHLTQQFHYHDYYQIYFVDRGCLTHCINNISLKLMRGDCFIVPPNTAHKIELDQKNSSFISFSFYEDFLPDSLRNQENIRDLFAALNGSSLQVRIILKPQDLLQVEQCIKLSLEEFNKADNGYECILQGQLVTILVIFSRAYKYIRRVKHDNLLLPCLEYINSNYFSPITAKDVAARMYLSESTFYRYFTKIIGCSFKEYLTMIRIRNACQLLKDGNEPLSQIAYRCGYSNYSVFYRAFVQEMQIPPAGYQKSMRTTSD